jgi:hypothetical protein
MFVLAGCFFRLPPEKTIPFQNRIAIQLRITEQFAADPQKSTLEI